VVREVAVHCGGSKSKRSRRSEPTLVELQLSGPDRNVNLIITDVTERMAANIPDVFQDLVELASYIYAADQAVPRGDADAFQTGNPWRRSFKFFVPVRNPDLWASAEIRELLKDVLLFITDDEYDFTFDPLREHPPFEQFFDFAPGEMTGPIDEVVLFSGGLDSLAGVVHEGVVAERRVALVSHRPVPKTDSKQQDLLDRVRPRCKHPPLPVPVWVNKSSQLSRDYSQRTRSFLYASLAATVARMLDLNRIRFYENGVTSWNLPVSEQLTSAKASRTTHPQTLSKLTAFFEALTQSAFSIDNPLLWKTKAEVVNEINRAGCGDLIKYSVSCQHTIAQSAEHPHCGRCFQCVGRRFVALASDCPEHDPAQKYKVDLLTGARPAKIDRTLAESFYRTYVQMGSMTDLSFFSNYGEANRALTKPVLNHLSRTVDQVASGILDLHRRQSSDVLGVMRNAFAAYAGEIVRGQLPETCLIVLALPENYRTAGVQTSAEQQLGRGPAKQATAEPTGKFHYSKRDERVYLQVLKLCQNVNAFEVWTDSELLRRIQKHRHTDSELKGRSDFALRACFTRIRDRKGFQRSRAMRNIGKPPP